MTAGVVVATFSGLVSASGSAALTGSAAAGVSSGLASVAASSLAGSSLAASSAGLSSVLGDVLLLMVARSLENGLLDSPSEGLGDFSRLPRKGRDDLRFSLTSFLGSPLVVTSVVSVGTVAGELTSTARGVVDSTGGMTGAVSVVAGTSSSLGVSAVSAGLVSATFFSFLEKTLPKKLLRLEAFSLGDSAGLASSAGFSSAGASVVAATSGAGVSSALGASSAGLSASTGAGVSSGLDSSALTSSFFSSLGSSFLLMKPKNEARLLLEGLGDSAFSSGLVSSTLAGSSGLGASSAASSALGASAGFSSLAGTAGLKLSTVFL